MATVKNFGLAGVGSNVQYGKGNGRLKYDTNHFEVRNAADAALIELYVATPVGGSDANSAASKEYVDSVAAGLDPKESVIVATVESLTTTFGTVPVEVGTGVGHTLTDGDVAKLVFTIDGITPTIGQRILVKDEELGENNGIYTITTLGVLGATAWVLTRATDFDGTPSNEVSGGAFTFIESGTSLADTGWVVSSPTGNATVDTTDIVWTQFSAAGLISVSGTSDRISVVQTGNDYKVDIDAAYVGQTSITTLGTIATGTWEGTTVAIAQGGTGQVVLDDIVAAATNHITVTGGTAVLIGNGTDLTLDVNEANLDLDAIGGTLTLTAAAGNVAGILPVLNGGTGLGTITQNGMMFGNAAGIVGVTAAGEAGQILRAGPTPAFTTLTMPATITEHSLFVANAADTLVEVTELGTPVASAVVVAGGSGYAVNDTLTVLGGVLGANGAATFNVDAVSTGAITAVSLVSGGGYVTNPSLVANAVTTGGGGTGATLTLTMGTNIDQLMIWDESATAFAFVTADSIGGNKFSTITGDEGDDLLADSGTDTLTLTGGAGITTTGTGASDVMTFDMDTTALVDLGVTLDAGVDLFFVDDGATGSVIKTVTAQDIVNAATINIITTITGDIGSATLNEETETLNFSGNTGIEVVVTDVSSDPDVNIAFKLSQLSSATMIAGDEIMFRDGGADTPSVISVTNFLSTFAVVVDGDFATQGFMTSDGSGSYTQRTLSIAGDGNLAGLAVTNGDGTVGNPTFGLDLANNDTHVDGIAVAADLFITYDVSGTENTTITAQQLADSLKDLTNDDRIVSPDGFTNVNVNNAGKISLITKNVANNAGQTFATFDTTVDALQFNFTNSIGEIEIQAGNNAGFGSSANANVDIRFTPGLNGEVIFGAAGTDATLTSSSGAVGENFVILAGDGSAGDGGDITLTPGTGTGADGNVCITDDDSINVMCFEGVDSAVNYISLTNAAAAGNPVFSVVGTANQDMGFLGAGTGVLTVTGTTTYELQVTDDDDIPNKAYVDIEAAAVLSGSISSFKFTVALNANANTDPATSEVPAGATVMRVYMNVTAADSGSTLTIGTTSGGAEYADATTNDPSDTGLYVADLFSGTVGDIRAVVASAGGTPVASAVVGDVAGTGYVTGDIVSLAGGTLGAGGAATFTVTAVAGVITALALLSGGGYQVDPSLDENALVSDTGVGINATADVTMGTAGSADVIVEYKNA